MSWYERQQFVETVINIVHMAHSKTPYLLVYLP